jgi:hypothetical protein
LFCLYSFGCERNLLSVNPGLANDYSAYGQHQTSGVVQLSQINTDVRLSTLPPRLPHKIQLVINPSTTTGSTVPHSDIEAMPITKQDKRKAQNKASQRSQRARMKLARREVSLLHSSPFFCLGEVLTHLVRTTPRNSDDESRTSGETNPTTGITNCGASERQSVIAQ